MSASVHPIRDGERADVVAVFADAFRDYPVMRFVLGATPAPDDPRLIRLIDLFVAARFLRHEPVLGTRDEAGRLSAVATMTLPGDRPAPPAFLELRETIWREIGPDARARYEAFGLATQAFSVRDRHHHLNMIGVRRSFQGRGLARALLDAVHALAAADAGSAGVSLTTEHRPNVDLYERSGYRILGHARVSDELETWAMFRPHRWRGSASDR